jgi:hypothetical protein
MSSCQSFDDSEISSLRDNIPNWELSYAPTVVEYTNIGEQSVEIDFTLDETMKDAITYRCSYYRDDGQVFEGDLFDTFTTFDKLAEFYDRSMLDYQFGYSSFWDPFGGDAVYPAIEYALGQECFRDDCSTEVRKLILRMALDKHKRKIGRPYLLSFNSRRTGMLLKSVILLKEEDASFIATYSENPDIQNTLRLNLDTENIYKILSNKEIDSTLCQIADNFLSVKN